MKKFEFRANINAPVKKVWDTMLGPETYKEWTNVSWPGSFYQGNWKQGEEMRFISNDGSGMLAHIREVKPYENILAEHIAVLGEGGVEDRDSDMAKSWIGATERYTFNENNGKTELVVEMHANPAWEKMLSDGWAGALDKLKEISERQ